MCGILGAIGVALSDEDVGKLSHRGPDGRGRIAIDVGRCRLDLAHTRLAIQDLTPTGDQPMWSQGRRALISYNGEIYNHRELRRKYPDVPFRGTSDTETLVNHLASFQAGKLQDLNGIFALAAAWPEDGKVVLARDRFGVKPLYYAVLDQGVVFSSELSPLLRHVTPDLDRQALSSLLRLRYAGSPHTILKQIRKVRPGHCVEIDCRSGVPVLHEYPYVTPAHPGMPQEGQPGDYEALFAEAIENAVEWQLLSDVEVGVFLSGGLDSAVVAALARRKMGQPMKAFTVGFEGGGDACEIADAARTAVSLGLEHHAVRMSREDFLGTLYRAVEVVEEPLATTSVIPLFALSRFAGEQVKVVLSGQGADESMGGYARYRGELLGCLLPRKLFAMAERLGMGHSRRLTMSRAVRSLSIGDEIERFLAIYSVFSAEDIVDMTGEADVLSEQLIRYTHDLAGCVNRDASVSRMMSIDLRMGLSDDLLLYTDKISMAHSLECRVPLLDTRLIALVERMPARERVNLFGGKRLLKRYAKKLLPDEVIRRPKRGFNSPTASWLRDRNFLMEQLYETSGAFATCFDPSVMEKIIHEYLDGYRPDTQVFLLLSIRAWMERYVDA